MAATPPVTDTVMTSPSFVIVEDAAAVLPKFFLGFMVLCIGIALFVALMVFISAVLPGIGKKIDNSLCNHPWQSFTLGVTAYAVLGSLAAFIISSASVEYLLRTEYDPFLLTLGIIICALMVIMTFIGGTGLVKAIGGKLENLNKQDMSGLRKIFWGSLTLVGASLFPAIGWLIILPASLFFAFGALIRAMLPNRK